MWLDFRSVYFENLTNGRRDVYVAYLPPLARGWVLSTMLLQESRRRPARPELTPKEMTMAALNPQSISPYCQLNRPLV